MLMANRVHLVDPLQVTKPDGAIPRGVFRAAWEFEEYWAKLKRELPREAYKKDLGLLEGFQLVCKLFVLQDAVLVTD